MIEVYVNTSEKITLEIKVGGALQDADAGVTIEIINHDTNTTLVAAGTVADHDSVGSYSYLPPLSTFSQPAKLKATWSFQIDGEAATRVDWIDVVVPYATPQDIIDTCPDLASKTTDQIKEMERRARHTIDNYTGQSFDFENDITKVMSASGGDNLQLNHRLRYLEKIVDQNGLVLFDRDDSGNITTEHASFEPETPWVIRKKYDWPYPSYEAKSDISPYLVSKPLFRPGRQYSITGDWGWDYVPNEINLAAILLTETYFNPTSNYRRYGVWWADTEQFEMRFGQDLLGTTGNTEVDYLLMSYINSGVTML